MLNEERDAQRKKNVNLWYKLEKSLSAGQFNLYKNYLWEKSISNILYAFLDASDEEHRKALVFAAKCK